MNNWKAAVFFFVVFLFVVKVIVNKVERMEEDNEYRYTE